MSIFHFFSKTYNQRLLILSPIILLSIISLSGCKLANTSSSQELKMAPISQMPADVQKAPVTVQEAYQFTFANPEIMQSVPCYCGCGAAGHKSNSDCYVKEVNSSGEITYDQHGLGCSICVDITQDVMRLLREGKSVKDIRSVIDQTYAQYGPSNMPSNP